jgi:chaperonin GroES
MSKLQPMNGNVILKPIDSQEETFGNIIIPDLGKERPEIGEVAAVSDTFNWNQGVWKQTELKVGDKVLIPKLGAMKISVEGQDYFICKENDILGIIKN